MYKCTVKDCNNKSTEGIMVGLLCLPCHLFVSGDERLYSQAYRNTHAMIQYAVKEHEKALIEKLKIYIDKYTI